MEWKAIFDMIPTEFSLDLVVLYLIIQFARDILAAENGGAGDYRNGAIRSIA